MPKYFSVKGRVRLYFFFILAPCLVGAFVQNELGGFLAIGLMFVFGTMLFTLRCAHCRQRITKQTLRTLNPSVLLSKVVSEGVCPHCERSLDID